MALRRPSGFIEPCLPSKVARPPSGPLWVHEIKHDSYRGWLDDHDGFPRAKPTCIEMLVRTGVGPGVDQFRER
jgi:hypothetical protein